MLITFFFLSRLKVVRRITKDTYGVHDTHRSHAYIARDRHIITEEMIIDFSENLKFIHM